MTHTSYFSTLKFVDLIVLNNRAVVSFVPYKCCVCDQGRIATTPDILPHPYVLKLGQFCFEVPLEDDVKPNFRTPPMVFHIRRGAAAKDI
jgi:hypothetical protein